MATSLMPLTRMLSRVESDKAESDLHHFRALMLLGEMVTKLVIAGLVAGIGNDKDRSRYAALQPWSERMESGSGPK
jgi:hypothetical protein